MKITAEPRSDQWNADDFIGGPRTFTIGDVKVGKAEQKYDIELIEGEGRAWRPPLSMLRVLINVWGDEAADWRGRRVTLYNDKDVSFGREKTGGIRISHMSGISSPAKVSVTVSRGKRGIVTIQPLPEAPATPDLSPFISLIYEATDMPSLQAVWGKITATGLGGVAELVALKDAKKKELGA